jgi:hypothetical protein
MMLYPGIIASSIFGLVKSGMSVPFEPGNGGGNALDRRRKSIILVSDAAVDVLSIFKGVAPVSGTF